MVSSLRVRERVMGSRGRSEREREREWKEISLSKLINFLFWAAAVVIRDEGFLQHAAKYIIIYITLV